MSDEKVHDFRSLTHKTLAGMAEETLGGKASDVGKELTTEAAQQGHDAFVPSPVTVQGQDGKLEIRGAGSPATPKGQRGRIAIFMPASERVTIIRERVGQSYAGLWIHEVVNREGKKFLASDIQLKPLS